MHYLTDILYLLLRSQVATSVTGTEILLTSDSVLGDLPASSKGTAKQQVHHIGEIDYLAADQTTNKRQSSKLGHVG